MLPCRYHTLLRRPWSWRAYIASIMSKRSTVVAAVVVALLASASPAQPAESPQTVKNFRVAIENTKPGVTAPVLKATQGDSLTIDVTSDRPGTVEVHGYQKKVDVAPGRVATLSFVATIAGRFPLDLHGRDGRHLDVTALEVQPR